MTTSIRPPRKYSHNRIQYGAYADIYYKHAVKQYILYGIKHDTYREYYGIEKQNMGKSLKYIIDPD